MQVYAPSPEELMQRLDDIRLGYANSQRCECIVRLMGDIEGRLVFMRVNHPQGKDLVAAGFAGWMVQLCGCSEDYNSFALACMGERMPAPLESACFVELRAHGEAIDSRCILSHSELLEWVTHELSGRIAADRYRWIDFSIAFKELA